MKYENAPGYPEHDEGRAYDLFGYPSAMLIRAMVNDDAEGFKFYFTRYFSIDGMTLISDSPVYVAAHKGAPNCVKWLLSIGAKDPTRTPDELTTLAQRNWDEKVLLAEKRAA